MRTTKTTNTTRKPRRRERAKARKIVVAKAKKIARMTPAELKQATAEITRVLNDATPGLEVVESDGLRMLMIVGAEFIRRYFPDATQAVFHISKYPNGLSSPDFSFMLPMAVPADLANG